MSLKWDKRFMKLAKLVSTWSKDPSTQCGAVIINKDRTILSVGYNGFPKNMRDCKSFYINRDIKYSKIIHAEMNAALNAKQSVQGCTLYVYPFSPCDRCCVFLLQAGIVKFVFPKLPKLLKSRWAESITKTKAYIEEAGVNWREI